jgi:hypothetical protein
MMKLSQILPLVVVGGALATSLVAWEKPAQAITFNWDASGLNVSGSGQIELGDTADQNGFYTITNIWGIINFNDGSAGQIIGLTDPVPKIKLNPPVFPPINFQYQRTPVGDFPDPNRYENYAFNESFTVTPVPFDISPGAILPTIPILALMYLWKQSRNRMALKTINNPDVTVSTYRQVG